MAVTGRQRQRQRQRSYRGLEKSCNKFQSLKTIHGFIFNDSTVILQLSITILPSACHGRWLRQNFDGAAAKLELPPTVLQKAVTA